MHIVKFVITLLLVEANSVNSALLFALFQLYPLSFSAARGPESVSLANGNSERADESRNSQQYATNLKTFSKSQESVV